jgi:hypothetical protein
VVSPIYVHARCTILRLFRPPPRFVLPCAQSVLGQYRFPVRHYWRALVVQLAAYEVQYELQWFFEKRHAKDNMDYAISNTAGAMGAVLTACFLSFIVESICHRPYQTRLLRTKTTEEDSYCGRMFYWCNKRQVECMNCLGIGRRSQVGSETLTLLPCLCESALSHTSEPKHTHTHVPS